MLMQSILTTWVFALTRVHAAPSRGYEINVPGIASGSSSSSPEITPANEQPESPIAKLPGYNHMLHNDSKDPASGADPMAADAVFGGQCRGLTLGGHGKKGQTTLEARCIDDAGQLWYTTLNLNSCIGNGEGGNLVYDDVGNFDDTCRPCILGKDSSSGEALLKCNCLAKPGGVPKYTDLLLGMTASDELSVRPVNGRLVCGSHEGTKSPGFGPVSDGANGEQASP